MPRLLSLLLAASSLSAVSGCYSERLPPPTFRHSCGGDGECGEGEACMSGLCQVPCTMATAQEDCGLSSQGGSYLACINGACASACNLDNDPCPGAQSCTELPGLSEQIGAGLCMETCTPDSCPEGEACAGGFCATECDPADPMSCPEGQFCLVEVCVPGELDPTAGADTTPSSESEGSETGDTAGATEGDTE